MFDAKPLFHNNIPSPTAKENYAPEAPAHNKTKCAPHTIVRRPVRIRILHCFLSIQWWDSTGALNHTARNSIFVVRLSTHAKRAAVDHSKFTITEPLLFIVHSGTTKLKIKCMQPHEVWRRKKNTNTTFIIFLVLYFGCLSGISVVYKYGSVSA